MSNFETLALHAGQEIDATFSRGVPLYRTSSYVFKNAEHAANLFGLRELGNIYTRLMNPTHDVLEKRVAALEGGAAALAVASGTSAIFYAIINIARAGDEIVSANNLYGGTYTQFHDILPHFGITVKFVDPSKAENFDKAVTPKTRAIFVETIGNPYLDAVDLEAVSKVAKKHHIPLIADATFSTPFLTRPFDYGADIIVHSLTKWIGGHGTGIGGILVEKGGFDWTDKKFSLYTEPEPSYHGLRFGIDLPEPLKPVAFMIRARTVPLRNLGAAISPDNAWMFLQGLETLPLRMERHSQNTLAVAQFLKKHPKVEWVRYPGLPDDPAYPVAKKQSPRNLFGGVTVFGIKGGAKAGAAFIDHLKLFSHLANVGDAKSLAIHPATTTHSQLSPEQQLAGGIKPELVRLSVGIEHIDDILKDLEGALAKA